MNSEKFTTQKSCKLSTKFANEDTTRHLAANVSPTSLVIFVILNITCDRVN